MLVLEKMFAMHYIFVSVFGCGIYYHVENYTEFIIS